MTDDSFQPQWTPLEIPGDGCLGTGVGRARGTGSQLWFDAQGAFCFAGTTSGSSASARFVRRFDVRERRLTSVQELELDVSPDRVVVEGDVVVLCTSDALIVHRLPNMERVGRIAAPEGVSWTQRLTMSANGAGALAMDSAALVHSIDLRACVSSPLTEALPAKEQLRWSLSPDAKLALVCFGKLVRLYTLPAEAEPKPVVLKGPRTDIDVIAWDPAAELVWAHTGSNVFGWPLAGGKPTKLKLDDKGHDTLRVVADGSMVLVHTSGSTPIEAWDPVSGKRAWAVKAKSLLDVFDDEVIAIAHKEVLALDVRTGAVRQSLLHDDKVRSVASHPGQGLVAMSSEYSAEVVLLSPPRGERAQSALSDGHSATVKYLRAHETLPLALTSGHDNRIVLWDLSTQEAKSSFSVPFMKTRAWVGAVAFSSTAEEFYGALGHSIIRFAWNGDELAKSASIGRADLVEHVHATGSPRVVVGIVQGVLTSSAAKVVVCDAESLETIHEVELGRPSTSYWGIDAATGPSSVLLKHQTGWDTLNLEAGALGPSVELPADYPVKTVAAVATAPEGRMLAIKELTYSAKGCTLIDVASGRELLHVDYGAYVRRAVFGAGGRWFAAVLDDRIECVESHTGRVLHTIDLASVTPSSVFVQDEGRRLFVESSDHRVCWWELPEFELGDVPVEWWTAEPRVDVSSETVSAEKVSAETVSSETASAETASTETANAERVETSQVVAPTYSSAKQLGDLVLLSPKGHVYRVPERKLLAEVPSDHVLFHMDGRVVSVSTGIGRSLTALDLETREILWRRKLKTAISDVVVLHAGGRPLLGMSTVAKWGGGARTLIDPSNGESVDMSGLGDAFAPRSTSGTFLADPAHHEHYGIHAGDWVDVYRSSDGAAVLEIALPSIESDAQTTTDSEGRRFTTQAIRFHPNASFFFGPAGVLLSLAGCARYISYANEVRWEVPIDGSVFWAEWDGEGVLALLRHDKVVNAVRLDAKGSTVLWPDCNGVAIVHSELVTSSGEVGDVHEGRCSDALPAEPDVLNTARTVGPIQVDAAVIQMLAKIRALEKAKTKPGLSLAELTTAEESLGRELPSSVLAILAARSPTLKRRWKIELARFGTYVEEVAQIEVEHLAEETRPRNKPFPKETIPIGVSNARYRGVAGSQYWCAHGDSVYLIRRLVTWESAEVRGPASVVRMLAMELERLRKSRTKKWGAACVAELEAEGVKALRELRLEP